jgi:RNA polymerase sigma-70 factor (ECF subfamily)
LTEKRSTEVPVPGGGPASADNAVEGEIAARFWGRVRVLASRFLRDRAAAEDVAQETMRRVIEALRSNRLENPDALAGFVFQTARNVCLHYSRSRRRGEAALSRFAYSAAQQFEEDPLGGALGRERMEQLRTAIDRLDSRDRELLHLFYVEGLGAADVAERLGTTAGAVRVRKHRALQEIIEMINRRNVSPDAGTKE